MRLASIWTLCLILGHSVSAQAELGFMSPNDPRVPLNVRESAKSVLKFITTSGSKTTVATNDPRFLATLQNPAKSWDRSQWATCVQNKESLCHVFDQQGNGTGFVFRDSSTVATNLHNVIERVTLKYSEGGPEQSHEARVKKLNNMGLFAALETPEQKTVVNPTEAPPRLSFFPNVFKELALGFSQANTSAFRLSDYVEITTSKLGAVPLKPAARAPQPGEKIFLVGYPLATKDRAPFGKLDADGVHQVVSSGRVVTFAEFQAASGGQVEPEFREKFESNLIFTDLDCDHGNSGGPMLNEKGEVVAIFMAFYGELPNRRCVGLRTQPHQALENLWSQL